MPLLILFLAFEGPVTPEGLTAFVCSPSGVLSVGSGNDFSVLRIQEDGGYQGPNEITAIWNIALRANGDAAFVASVDKQLTSNARLFFWCAPSDDPISQAGAKRQLFALSYWLQNLQLEGKQNERFVDAYNFEGETMFWSPDGSKLILWAQRFCFQIDLIKKTLKEFELEELEIGNFLVEEPRLWPPVVPGANAYLTTPTNLIEFSHLEGARVLFDWPVLPKSRTVFGKRTVSQRTDRSSFDGFLNDDQHAYVAKHLIDKKGNAVVSVGKEKPILSGDHKRFIVIQRRNISLFGLPGGELLARYKHDHDVDSVLLSEHGNRIAILGHIKQHKFPSIRVLTVLDLTESQFKKSASEQHVEKAFFLGNDVACFKNNRLRIVTSDNQRSDYELTFDDDTTYVLIYQGKLVFSNVKDTRRKRGDTTDYQKLHGFNDPLFRR
ncbi:MAG: hypothetical protein KDC35_18320 [Acidobacteria bacterium]|nr:hypothetical protein [Acidobacteriota bacterium]